MNMCGAPISAGDDAQWIAVCAVDLLQNRQIVCVTVSGVALIVIRDGGAVYVTERTCPHEQADLGRGHVVDGRLHCPRHLAWFDLASGAISPGWSSRALRRYTAKIHDETVFIDGRTLAT